MQPILFPCVFAGLIHLLPRQTDGFLEPNLDRFVLTVMEIVHNLVSFLRKYFRNFLAGDLDDFGKIDIFLVRNTIIDLILALFPVLEAEADLVLLNLFEGTVEDRLASYNILDAVGLVANRTIVCLESLLTRYVHL